MSLVRYAILLAAFAAAIRAIPEFKLSTRCYCNETSTVFECSIPLTNASWSTALNGTTLDYYCPLLTKVTLSKSSIISARWITPSLIRFSDLASLSLSQNRISILEPQDFANMSNVAILDLESNLISYIAPNTFQDMTSLIRLHLSSNKLVRIEGHYFSFLSMLDSLYMEYNPLTMIDPASFAMLPRLATLGLSCVNEVFINGELLLPQAQLTLLMFQCSKLVNGSLAAFTNISTFILMDPSLTFIDTLAFKGMRALSDFSYWRNLNLVLSGDVFQYAENLTSLQLPYKTVSSLKFDLSFNGTLYFQDQSLSNLSANYFVRFPRLTHLNLKSVQLKYIDKDAFRGLPNLRTLNLASNQLSSLPVGVFASLSSLTDLDFSTNSISEFFPSHFMGLASLTYLSMYKNPFTLVPSNAFMYTPKLEILYLSTCNIKRLDDHAFDNTPSLRYLALNGNPLAHIGRYAFHSSLITISFSNYVIEEVAADAYFGCTLPVIDLSKQRLTRLGPNVFHFANITRSLSVAFNVITAVDVSAFANMTRLNTLELNQNLITYLPVGLFDHTPNLVSLLLDTNKMTMLESGIFFNLLSLQTLYLRANNISVVETEVFPPHSLLFLTFQDNPTDCEIGKHIEKMDDIFCTCAPGLVARGNSSCYPLACSWPASSGSTRWTLNSSASCQWVGSPPCVGICPSAATSLPSGSRREFYCVAESVWSLCSESNTSCRAGLSTSLVEDPFLDCEASSSGGSNSGPLSSEFILVVALLASLVMVALLVVFVIVKRRRKGPNRVHLNSEMHRLEILFNRSQALMRQGVFPASLISDSEQTREELLLMDFPPDSISMEKTLGQGFYGIVLLGRLKVMNADDRMHFSEERSLSMQLKESQKEIWCAIKSPRRDASPEEELKFFCECRLLALLRHPHIVRLIGLSTASSPIRMLLEYLPRGNLRDYLRSHPLLPVHARIQLKGPATSFPDASQPAAFVHNDSFPPVSLLLMYLHQIASALQYLETHNIVHRDVASRNVLVAEVGRVKLSDFGLSKWLENNDYYRQLSQDMVPFKWLAPESIEDRVYTSKSDVWSFGVLSWEVMSYGGSPFAEYTVSEALVALNRGRRLERPRDCPDDVYDVMLSCWQILPSSRPSFAHLSALYRSLSSVHTIPHPSSQRGTDTFATAHSISTSQLLSPVPGLFSLNRYYNEGDGDEDEVAL